MKNLQNEIESILKIYRSGNFSKAEKHSKRLLKKFKKSAFLHNLIGLILSALNKNDEALKYYIKCTDLDPNFAIAYNNMALLFFNKGGLENINKSKKLYKKSILLDKKIVEPFNNLGNLYNSIGNFKKSIECYNEALKINPNFYLSYFNLASVNITNGDFDKARQNLKKCIEINQNFMQAHRSLSRITNYNKKDTVHLNQLLNLLSLTNDKDVNNKIQICFSLGKAFEDLNDFKKSFFYFKEANKLCRKNIHFSIFEEEKKIKKIKTTFNKDLFKKFEKSGLMSKSPIFILGMPRSGTTLVEQILSNHSEVYGCDELNFIPELIYKNFINIKNNFYENPLNFEINKFTKCAKEYILKVSEINNKVKNFTDKLPINFLNIGFIKLILPNAKIVHCMRNPKDNILSIYKNYFTNYNLNFAYDINELVGYYKLYSDLMNHWKNVLPNFIYDIKYENLVTDTKNEVSKMLKFCDLSWQNDCLDFHKNKKPIKTASDVQAREKIYTKSVNSWENYKIFFEDFNFNLVK